VSTHRNTSPVPIDLSTGQIVNPGADTTLPRGEDGNVHAHDQAHVDAGRLRPLAKSQPAPKAPKPTTPATADKE
jgi:hypothetical protein